MTVLVDEIDNEDFIAICRSYADAPEIDGHVYVDDIVKRSGSLESWRYADGHHR